MLRITVFLLFLSSLVNAQNAFYTKGQENFEKLSYLEAIRNYELFLRIPGENRAFHKTALEHLAFSYKKVQDYTNAEKTYRELFKLFEKELSNENYLYFAQSLASVGNQKEAQKYYSQYGEKQKLDLRAGKFSVAYMDPSIFYKDSSLYRIEYLEAINSNQGDFSPMFYEEGLVFVSARKEGGVFKRMFMHNETPFLDLFLFPDTSLLANSTSWNMETASLSGGKNYTSNDNVVDWGDKYTIEKSDLVDEFSKKINSKYHEGPVTFFKDYSKLVFTRNNYQKGRAAKNKDGITMLKLYSAEKGNKKWESIEELPFNSDEYSCGHPALNHNDTKMYFVSDMPGGYGGTDLYVVEYRNGKWGSPINLGKEINTQGNEMFPFIDANNNLYFASDGHAGLGGLDIFFVEMREERPFGEIENLGFPINSDKDDFGLITNGERSSGYFSSNRKRGFSDDNIYGFNRKCRDLKLQVYDAETEMPLADVEVRMIQNGVNQALFLTNSSGEINTCISTATEFEFKVFKDGYDVGGVSFGTMSTSLQSKAGIKIYLQPGKLPLVKGTIRSELTNAPIAGVTVHLRNQKDGSVEQVITGSDGKYVFQPIKKGKYEVIAAKEKYATNTEELGKVKARKSENSKYEQNIGMIAEGDIFRIDNIYYDYGKYEIRTDARKALERFVNTTLRKYPELVVEIRSHTDSQSSAEFNLDLSEKRAAEVVEFLKKKGINAQRLSARGFGETMLVNGCIDNRDCPDRLHQQNRRTEFRIIAVKEQYASAR